MGSTLYSRRARARTPGSTGEITSTRSRRCYFNKGLSPWESRVSTDWTFAQTQASDELALLHFFSINKRQGEKTVEFRITVKEYATPNHLSMKFFAQADKET